MNIQNELSSFLKNHIKEYDETFHNIKVELKSDDQFEIKSRLI